MGMFSRFVSSGLFFCETAGLFRLQYLIPLSHGSVFQLIEVKTYNF